MKKSLLILSFFAVALLFSGNINAQTATGNNILTLGIPGIALLATDVAPVELTLTTNTAGAMIAGGTGQTHVQISSIVASGLSRTINATVTGVPAGTALSVTTTSPSNGNQAGVVGTGISSVNLINSTPAVDLVTGIGSCYTGTATTDGFTLDYSWEAGLPADYGTIVEVIGGTATVILTITDDQ